MQQSGGGGSRRSGRMARAAAVLLSGALFLCCACRSKAPERVQFHLVPEITMTPAPLPTTAPAPAFYLNLAEDEIYGGGVCQLVAYHNPGGRESDTVYWTSSDERVAIVEEYGVVIGLSEGRAVITAHANDGSGDTAACSVAVTSSRPQPRESLRLRNNCYQNGKQMYASRIQPIEDFIEGLDMSAPGSRLALSALRYVGNYYGTKEGNIDCSMLLLYACLDNGLRLPRRSDWQARALEEKAVPLEALQTGDFMFFAYMEGDRCSCRTAPACTRYLGVHHSAVYLGEVEGRRYLIEASSAIGRVVVRAWDGSDMHAGMRIVLCARPGAGAGESA